MVKALESIIDLTTAVKVPGGVVIDFGAPWCGPCKAIAPKFEALSLQYPTIAFYGVNIDAATEIAEQLQITSVPTFMFFYGGKYVSSVTGANLAGINEELKKLTTLK
eukprot:Pompholyxophrys_sp_v1_NODE_3_length_18401_cov_4.332280.p16 type:complete len:107 gc:universal NODE_3_length_18401_cov_4.332280:13810-13490(-)